MLLMSSAQTTVGIQKLVKAFSEPKPGIVVSGEFLVVLCCFVIQSLKNKNKKFPHLFSDSSYMMVIHFHITYQTCISKKVQKQYLLYCSLRKVVEICNACSSNYTFLFMVIGVLRLSKYREGGCIPDRENLSPKCH